MLSPQAVVSLCALFQRTQSRSREGRGGEGKNGEIIKEIRTIIPILQGFATSIEEVRYTPTMLTICSSQNIMSFILSFSLLKHPQPTWEQAQGSLWKNKPGGARALGDQVHSG